MNEETDTLFSCPECKGWHFHITEGGLLVCTSVIKRPGELGCGWKGHLSAKPAVPAVETPAKQPEPQKWQKWQKEREAFAQGKRVQWTYVGQPDAWSDLNEHQAGCFESPNMIFRIHPDDQEPREDIVAEQQELEAQDDNTLNTIRANMGPESKSADWMKDIRTADEPPAVQEDFVTAAWLKEEDSRSSWEDLARKINERAAALRSEVERLKRELDEADKQASLMTANSNWNASGLEHWRQRAYAAEKRAGELEKERDQEREDKLSLIDDFNERGRKLEDILKVLHDEGWDGVNNSKIASEFLKQHIEQLRAAKPGLPWRKVSEPLEDEREEVLVAGGGKGPVVTRLYQRSAIRTHYLRLCDLPEPVDADLEERKRFIRWRDSFDFSDTYSEEANTHNNNIMFAAWKAGQQAAAKSSHEA